MYKANVAQCLSLLSLYINFLFFRYDDFLERLAKREKYDMGITFTDFKEFFQFLNNLDDFAIAMRMYTLADKAISKSKGFSMVCIFSTHLRKT